MRLAPGCPRPRIRRPPSCREILRGRCRRRTWRPCEARLRAGIAVTSTLGWDRLTPTSSFGPPASIREPTPSTGGLPVRRFWTTFRETWESLEVHVDQVRDLGDEVLVLGTFEGHARDGMIVEREVAWIFGLSTVWSAAPRVTPLGRKPSRPPGCRSSALDEKRLRRFIERGTRAFMQQPPLDQRCQLRLVRESPAPRP